MAAPAIRRGALVVALTGLLTGLAGAGAGTAPAGAAAQEVTCTLLGGPLNEPVSVQPGSQVQLVLIVPPLGTRAAVGPAQSVGTAPGERLLQATVTGVTGLTGQVCQALVVVQGAVTSAVPLPPVTVPTVPALPVPGLPTGPLLPSATVELPLPGAEVGVDIDGEAILPGAGSAPVSGASPPPASGTSGWRYDRAGIPLSEFAAMQYGLGWRFGAAAAPAFRYGRDLAGYSPKFGILPEEDLTRVGAVEAFPLFGGRLPLPVLLAALMLAAVSGALARTWAVRRG